MTAFNSELLRRDTQIPNDLRMVLNENTLIRCVYEATHEVSWPKAPLPHEAEGDLTPQAVLRTLLVYSYAIGVYSTRDIEAATLHDPVTIYLAANHQPEWSTLRVFRRQNAIPLRRALAALFRLAASCSGAFNCDLTYAGYSTARFDLFDSNPFEHEADKRLKRAIQADSMALDD